MNLTWHTENPDFSKCFQKTALVWIPCAFLWIFCFFDIYYIRNSINRNIPWGFLNTTKSILTSSLIVLSCIDLTIVTVNQHRYYIRPADFWTPIIKIATFVSFLLPVNQPHKRIFLILKITYFRYCHLYCYIIIGNMDCGYQAYNSSFG